MVSSSPFAERDCSLLLCPPWLGIEQRRLRCYQTSLLMSRPSGSFISQFHLPLPPGCDLGEKRTSFCTALLPHFGSGILRWRRAWRFVAAREIPRCEQMAAKLLSSFFSSLCALQGAHKGWKYLSRSVGNCEVQQNTFFALSLVWFGGFL